MRACVCCERKCKGEGFHNVGDYLTSFSMFTTGKCILYYALDLCAFRPSLFVGELERTTKTKCVLGSAATFFSDSSLSPGMLSRRSTYFSSPEGLKERCSSASEELQGKITLLCVHRIRVRHAHGVEAPSRRTYLLPLPDKTITCLCPCLSAHDAAVAAGDGGDNNPHAAFGAGWFDWYVSQRLMAAVI